MEFVPRNSFQAASSRGYSCVFYTGRDSYLERPVQRAASSLGNPGFMYVGWSMARVAKETTWPT